MITPLPSGGGVGGGAAIFMGLCVFCSSVFFCEKKNIGDSWGKFFSYREHRALLLNLAMRFGIDESS